MASKYQNLPLELEACERTLSQAQVLGTTQTTLEHLDAFISAALTCRSPLESSISGLCDIKGRRFKGIGLRIQFSVTLEEIGMRWEIHCLAIYLQLRCC